MSNSPLVTYTKYSPHNYGNRTHAIDRITPHCVVGQCSIEALGAEFCKAQQKSSNYGIGADGRVGLFVDEGCVALTSSSFANDNRAVTIECASDTEYPYAFRPAVYERLIELCVNICKRNGKKKLLWLMDKQTALSYEPAPDEMVLTVHRWFAATACPGQWAMERMHALADRVTEELTEPEKHWYDDAMAWAEKTGLIYDGRPEDNVTRAELATVLQRYDAIQAARDKALITTVEKIFAVYFPEENKKESGLLTDE